jgi:hypothetical protein
MFVGALPQFSLIVGLVNTRFAPLTVPETAIVPVHGTFVVDVAEYVNDPVNEVLLMLPPTVPLRIGSAVVVHVPFTVVPV